MSQAAQTTIVEGATHVSATVAFMEKDADIKDAFAFVSVEAEADLFDIVHQARIKADALGDMTTAQANFATCAVIAVMQQWNADGKLMVSREFDLNGKMIGERTY